MTAPTRPALRYYGGKWKIAPWIISHFPAHTNYVEPCGGAASVLLQKEPAMLETFNDLDDRVINFFQVMRDNPEALIDKIRLTPWARAEFERCQESTTDPIENARRFWVLCWQSISKPGGSWRSMYAYAPRPRAAPDDGIEIDHLYTVAERWKHVQIEHKDALRVIAQYDGPETLIYFDPPYVASTRVNVKYYRHEMGDNEHTAAAEALRAAESYVVVSGYASPLYAELYEAHGWARIDSASVATNGGKRIESIWMSPRTVQALDGLAVLPLFAPAGQP